MSLVRDLWNDPDPIKWVILGGAGVSVVLGGVLVFQISRLSDLRTNLEKVLKQPASASAKASPGSLQYLVEKADEVKKFHSQIDDDSLINTLDDPTEYVYKAAAFVQLGSPSVQAAPGPGGPTWKDTVLSFTPEKDKPTFRDQIKGLLFNIQISPLITVTYLSVWPFEKNHKAGQPNLDDWWGFDAKFTIRQQKAPTEKR